MAETSLTLSRLLPLPVAEAWAAWTVPALMHRWWWPFLADTTVDLDPRVGGTYRLESVQAGFGATGEYREVTPDRRLVFSWSWISDGRPEATTDEVRVNFIPLESGCRVDLEHVLDPRLHDLEPLRQGWSETLDHLVRYAAETGR